MYMYICIYIYIYVRKLPVLSTSIQPRQLAWQFVSRSVSTVACRAVWGATRARAGQAYSPSHQAGNQGAGRANCGKGFKTDTGTTSTTGGYFFTMVSLVWLILYVVLPNCMFNARARV